MGSSIHIGTPGVPNRTYAIPEVQVDKYFLLQNSFSDVLDAAAARQNLGISGNGAGLWGSITGDILDQNDLVALFDGYAPLNNAIFTGNTKVTDLLLDLSGQAQVATKGKISWSSEFDTAILRVNSNDIKLGQDLLLRVVNASGYDMSIGNVVYADGVNSGKIAVRLALATTTTTATVLGVLIDNIPNGEEGFCLIQGTIKGLNTSSFNVGDEVFLSENFPGGVTVVEPVVPNIAVSLGWVLTSDAVNGEVVIIKTGGISGSGSGSSLPVGGSDPDATHNVLVWNDVNEYWQADHDFNNWNDAYGWGDHAGLYKDIAYVPAWGDITGKPFETLPIASSTVLGAIKVGANLSIDVNGVLNGEAGVGGANWGDIGGTLSDQTDLGLVLADKAEISGTPVANQLAVWASASAVQGLIGLTFDGTTLHVEGNITASGEISAFAADDPGTDFWDFMPIATELTVGGVILPGDTDSYLRGDGAWVTLNSGTYDHSGLSNLAYADSGHTGFLPDTHLTDFAHANIATAYGWGNHASAGYAPLNSPSFTGTVSIGSSSIVNGGDFELRGNGIGDSTAVRVFASGGILYLQNGSGNYTIFRSKTGGETMSVGNTGILSNAGIVALTPTNWGYSTGYKVIMLGSSAAASTVAIGYNPSGNANGSFSGNGTEVLFRRGVKFVTPNSGDNDFYLNNLCMLDGKVGIGNAAPAEALHVTGNIIATGEVTAYYSSDERLKYNINNFSALDIVSKLNPVTFRWNDTARRLNSTKDDRVNFGFIAQEVNEILPNLIHDIYDEYNAINYIQIIPILCQAIKELQLKIGK